MARTVKQLNVAIEKLGEKVGNVVQEVHEIALEALSFVCVEKSNQITPALKLISVLREGKAKGIRVEALVTWFKTFGQFVEDENGNLKFQARRTLPENEHSAMCFTKGEDGKDYYSIEKALEAANQFPFYELTKEEKAKKTEFDCYEMAVSLLKNMQSKAKKAAEGELALHHVTFIDGLKTLIAEYAQQNEEVKAAEPAPVKSAEDAPF